MRCWCWSSARGRLGHSSEVDFVVSDIWAAFQQEDAGHVGASATFFSAVHLASHGKCLLKVIAKSRAVMRSSSRSFGLFSSTYGSEDVETVRTEFHNELAAWRRIHDHENIACLVGSYEDKLNYALHVELLRGKTTVSHVLGLCLRGVYSAAAIVHILKGMFSAVQFLHSFDVAHLRLRPDCFIVESKSGLVKLLDMSGAFILDPDESKDDYGPCGSIPYRAPEMVGVSRRRTRDDLFKADAFSLGVISFLLLTGRLPKRPVEDFGSLRSESAKGFLSRMLDENPATRMGVPEALGQLRLDFWQQISPDAEAYLRMLGTYKVAEFFHYTARGVSVSSRGSDRKSRPAIHEVFGQSEHKQWGSVEREEAEAEDEDTLVSSRELRLVLSQLDESGGEEVDHLVTRCTDEKDLVHTSMLFPRAFEPTQDEPTEQLLPRRRHNKSRAPARPDVFVDDV